MSELDDSSSLGAAARTYAADLGWNVFPLQPRAKVPLDGSAGHLDASAEVAVVDDWWQRMPLANVGVALEASGLVVIDIDPRNGGSRAALERAVDVGSPVISETGAGGWHLLYADPGFEVRSKLSDVGLDGIDVKRRGYIVAPPSVHPNGARYTWGDDEITITPMPSMVRDLVRAPAHIESTAVVHSGPLDPRQQKYVDNAINGVCVRVASARDGERHDTQFAAACRLGELVGAGALDRARAEKRLTLAMTQLYGAPPNRSDLRDMRDGLDRGASNPRGVPDEHERARQLLRRMATAEVPLAIIELYFENNPEELRAARRVECKSELTAALQHVKECHGDAGAMKAHDLFLAS